MLHPHKVEIGDGFAVDDNGLVDARYIEPGGITIGDRVLIARDVSMVACTAQGTISIGHDSMVSRKCVLASTRGIVIGAWVAIASQCIIGGGRPPLNTESQSSEEDRSPKPIAIGDDCWLGAGVRVLDGVTIGRGSIIGAGAIVDRDIPDYTVVIGRQKMKVLPRESREGLRSSQKQKKFRIRRPILFEMTKRTTWFERHLP